MKKLFSLLTLALLTLTAWGATSTLTFEAACGGTGTADDGAVWTVTSDAAESVFDSTKGIHYGTSKVAVSYLTLTTSDIQGTITSIKVNASGAANQTPVLDVTVGGNAFGTQQTLSGDATVYTLTGEASGQIVVTISQASAKKALYCKSIEVTYETGDTPEPAVAAPVFNPNGGEFTGSLAVTVSCPTENASIYLFKVLEDETEEYVNMFFPNDEGVVSGEFYVTESGKYGAYAYKGSDVSNNTYATFTKVVPTCATPTFDPADGATFNEGEMLSVVISSATEGATITYSVNDDIFEGTTPVTVPVDMTTTITAMASKEGYNNSEEATATYTMLTPYNVGGTATFVALTDTIEGGTTAGWHTIVKDNVTMKFYGTVSNYTDNNSGKEYHEFRIYKNQSIQFTTAAGNIRKIEFTCSDSNPATGFDAHEGLTVVGDNGIWEGLTRDITFTTYPKQVRCTQIVVTLDDEVPSIVVADPVFDPETNTKFAGSQQVTITCETPDAAIYYSINDGDYQLYEGPYITLTETSTVKAYAELEGVQSNTVTAKYTKLVEVSTIAEANALPNKTDFIFYGGVVVVYQNGSNLWVKDNTGYGLIYGNKVPENIPVGSTLEEEWDAQYYLFRGHINEYQYPNNVTVSDAELVEIVPTEYAEAAIDTTKINERVLVKGLTLTAGNDPKYLYTADGMAIYNQFEIEYPTELEGKTFDVEGMVSYYNNAVQIMPIAITEVQAAGLIGDVNNDNVVNITDVTILISAVMAENFDNINFANADLSGDNIINITDVTMLINKVMAQ